VTFTDAILTGRAAMDAAKGETFTIRTTPGIYTGNVAAASNNPMLDVGGFHEDAALAIVASRQQFASLPRRGQIVDVRGDVFAIVGVQVDPRKVMLTLAGVNK
jgi:hypothetical protein